MSLKSTNKIETNTYELEIEASAEEFEAAVQAAYLKAKNKINVPGFRKGKATRKMIENLYGESCFYDDAVNAMVPEIVGGAIDEAKLTLVDRPEIDVTALSKENGVSFKVKCITKPEVEISDYIGIEVEKSAKTVTDEDVEKQLKAMQEKNGRLVTVEDRAVENGDTVVIDFEGFMDGKAFDGGKEDGFELKIGSGQFIPGFEEQIVGKSIGEDFDVNVTFPNEYHASELAGKPAVFKCKIHEIKESRLPELDDEFAKDVSEFDTLAEYKASVKAKMEESANKTADAAVDEQLMAELIAKTEGDIPEVMFENETDAALRDYEMRLRYSGLDLNTFLGYTGKTMEQLREDFRPQAIKQVKSRLALEAIARAENLEATDEDIEAEFGKIAEAYGMEVEKIKENIPAESIREDVLVGKAALLVRDNAVITKQRKKSTAKKTAKKEAPAEEASAEEAPAEEKASESEDK